MEGNKSEERRQGEEIENRIKEDEEWNWEHMGRGKRRGE